MTAPTGTVSPSLTLISSSVPPMGDGTSVSTLSVETSNSGSSSGDGVADGLEPLGDGAFGDGLTELGQGHVSHQAFRLLPVSESIVSPNSSERLGWGWMNSATSATVASQLTAR